MLGASVSLGISDIPWDGPIAGVRVGKVNGEYVINPTQEQMEASTMNVTVAGSEEAIMMVEGGAKEAPEEEVLDAIMFGHESIKELAASRSRLLLKSANRNVLLYLLISRQKLKRLLK